MLLSFSIGFGEISPNSSFPPLSIKREITLHSGYRAILSCFFLHLLNTLTPVQIPRYVLLLPVVVRARVKQFLPSSLLGRTHKQQQKAEKNATFYSSLELRCRSINQKVGVFLFYSFSSTLPLHTTLGLQTLRLSSSQLFSLVCWFGRLFLFALPANA